MLQEQARAKAQLMEAIAVCLRMKLVLCTNSQSSLLQAAQRIADELAALPSTPSVVLNSSSQTSSKQPVTSIPTDFNVSNDSSIDWSEFSVVSETVAFKRYIQVV
jgi:hypothetical protein